MDDVQIIDVNSTNVEKLGFFCRMSKKKTEGNKAKLRWLSDRFNEGLKIKMLKLPERGFIEYIPGEFAWRGVEAKGYMFIHCLWVVGKSKGNDFGNLLINECINDAKKNNMNGVSVITSNGNWLSNNNIYLKNGFEVVDEKQPFQLLVKKFNNQSNPKFSKNLDKNIIKHKNGITVFYTGQCPYLDDAKQHLISYAEKKNIYYKEIELKSAKAIREKSPSAHGVFNVIYNGKLLSYHYLLPKEIIKKIESIS